MKASVLQREITSFAFRKLDGHEFRNVFGNTDLDPGKPKQRKNYKKKTLRTFRITLSIL
jgi:hypothetical protein